MYIQMNPTKVSARTVSAASLSIAPRSAVSCVSCATSATSFSHAIARCTRRSSVVVFECVKRSSASAALASYEEAAASRAPCCRARARTSPACCAALAEYSRETELCSSCSFVSASVSAEWLD